MNDATPDDSTFCDVPPVAASMVQATSFVFGRFLAIENSGIVQAAGDIASLLHTHYRMLDNA